MRLVFLGGVFYPEMIDEIYADTKGMPDMAANALQWRIIKGMEQNLHSPLSILNAPFIATYPQYYKKGFFSHKISTVENGSFHISVSFINLFAARNLSIRSGLMRAARRIVKTVNPSEKMFVIVYALHSPWLQTAEYLKRIHPNCKTCFIVTDIPEYMDLRSRTGNLYRFLKKIDRHKIQKCIDRCDSFVLLTKFMRIPLKIGDKPNLIVEGMTDLASVECKTERKQTNGKSVVYTGTLNYAYGIKNLLDAMKYLDDEDLKLIICGSGEAEHDLEDMVWRDRRIRYLGVLSPAETVQLQRQATVLINPRSGEGEFTKYSFPSKILEYLSSGRPTILYKLAGIPDEYDPYVFYIRENTSWGIANTLREVLSRTPEELDSFGEKARGFVLSRKNNVVQTARILEMMDRL